jgi:iron(III) transport system substrate-binding protein
MRRRAFLAALAAAGVAVLLGCQPAAPGSPSGPATASGAPTSGAPPASWDQAVEAARREGAVTLYSAVIGDARDALTHAFERAYPGIEVKGTFAPPNQLVPRILAERSAEKHLTDVIVGPASQSVLVLKPAGALAPLRPVLQLPEVLDLSAWLENRLWWLDAQEPFTTLGFQGAIFPLLSYNTRSVDPGQFTSYRDLVDPKWKGKIVGSDVRGSGPGSTQIIFIYKHPELGPAFLARLYGDTDITLSNDQRQMIDWLAQGQYHLGLGLNTREIISAQERGLPVSLVRSEQFQESAPIGPGGGTVNLADRAPHPNAARVYINWLLSRDGQLAWQHATKQNSLRTDIAKDGLSPLTVPAVGVKYQDSGTEEFSRSGQNEVNEIITRALERPRS